MKQMTEYNQSESFSKADIDDVLAKLPWCWCGNPEEVLGEFLQILTILEMRSHDKWDESWPLFEEWYRARPGLSQLALHALDKANLIEHGGAARGSWLRPEGQKFLNALRYFGIERITDDAWGLID
jgi:hypothetical protein